MKYRVIERFRGTYPIKAMREVFEVSRSGYYAWHKVQKKMPKDQWLVDLIVECQQQCNQAYGIRRVRRWIKRQKGKTVNLKALLRVMRKTNLLAQIRRRRTYTQLKRNVYKYPNVLHRSFEQCNPNRLWATDITYIPTLQGMLYMCAVIDLCGRMVLAYRIGSDMSASLATQTIRDALITEKVTDGLALHSDQGAQYTSSATFDLSKEYHFQPSMSSPGCPYDNATMENFFGILKSECLYRAHDTTRSEVEELITQYVYFYNFECINLKNGLTPYEIRSKAA